MARLWEPSTRMLASSRNRDMAGPPVIRNLDLTVLVNVTAQILEASSSIGMFLVISRASEAEAEVLASRT
jgi:hypothetical protein